jgi:hypothetical protein
MNTPDGQEPRAADVSEQRRETRSQMEDILREIAAKECPPVREADIQNFNWEERQENFPGPIQQLLEAWLRYSKRWRYSYYTLTLGIILFGALSAALTDGDLWWQNRSSPISHALWRA